MSTSLLSRVRAATEEKPVPVDVIAGATVDQLRAAEQADGGQAADTVLTWLRQFNDEFTDALPSHVPVGRFLAAVRECLPGLVHCTPGSVRQALLACARFGLLPDGRHAVIKARGPIAVFIPMYQGYVDLMYRSGMVTSVRVGMIYEADEWSWEPSAPAPHDFMHKPRVDLPRADRGEPILAYAFCWMESGDRSQVIVLSREDAEEIRDEHSEEYRAAEQAGRADSFWHLRFNAMWLKSGLRRLFRVVSLSPELVALARVDDAGDAGRVQIAPDPDDVLLAEAEEAHERAEDSQDEPTRGPRPLPVKGSSKRGRSKPKRLRGGPR